MPNFVLTKRPPKAEIVIAEYRDEVRGALRKIGKAHVRSRERVVANWSARSKPGFKAATTVTVGRLALEILVDEADNDKPLWRWIDKTGTKRHIIEPKPSNPAQRLFFMAGQYLSKTGHSPARFGGPGVVQGGELAVAKRVNHPGFKPRKFSEQINKDLERDSEKEIRNAGRRGLRRARRR